MRNFYLPEYFRRALVPVMHNELVDAFVFCSGQSSSSLCETNSAGTSIFRYVRFMNVFCIYINSAASCVSPPFGAVLRRFSYLSYSGQSSNATSLSAIYIRNVSSRTFVLFLTVFGTIINLIILPQQSLANCLSFD